MTDLATILRRQLAEHERAAEELRVVLAGMSGGLPDNPPDDGADPLAVTVAELIEQCHAQAVPIVNNFFVKERPAGMLLGISPRTLKAWRGDLDKVPRIPFMTVERATVYDLRDLARFVLMYGKGTWTGSAAGL